MYGARQIAATVCLLCLLLPAWRAQERPGELAANVPHAVDPIPAEARVDINHASLEQLLKIPGMTPSWAGRIVRYRPYRTKIDLQERGIVPAPLYEQIRDYVIAHRNKQ